MMVYMQRRKLIGNLFLITGLLLILAAGLSFGWSQLQGALLRSRLSNLPPERPVHAVIDNQPSPTAPAASMPMTSTVTPEPTSTTLPPSVSASSTVTGTDAQLYRHIRVGGEPIEIAVSTPTPPAQPVRIVIPDLNLDVAVTDMTWKTTTAPNGNTQSEWQIPEYSAGHAIDSAKLGEPGNMVISGHNNIFGRVFMAISEAWGGPVERVDKATERSNLLNGRLIEVYSPDGRRYDYVISEFLRVQDSGVPLSQRIANGQYIEPGGDTRLTLTTCWPPWSNTHRLILIAKPAS